MLSLWWYPSSFTLNMAMLGIFIVYTFIKIILENRTLSIKIDFLNEKYLASYQTIILLLISLAKLNILVKL